MNEVEIVDSFAGGGGVTTGILDACQELGITPKLTSINHWAKAISTIRRSHPEVNAICQSMEGIDPLKVVPSGRLTLMTASPECTFFSNARGGKPVSEQLRMSPWLILRWLEVLNVSSVLLENVPEFKKWGGLDSKGRPIKSREGETYRCFLEALRSLGYSVEERELVAANYGDPTIRRRLFIMARKGNKRIPWPLPTHGKLGSSGLTAGLKPWVSARSVIDWEFPTESIFKRKKPLAPSTLRRIAAGLTKFCGQKAEPFLVMLYGTGLSYSVDKPLPTVTASGTHIGLVQPVMNLEEKDLTPFIIPLNHGCQDTRTYSIDDPLRTVTGFHGWGLVEPFLVKYYGTATATSVREPLDTVTTKDRFALVVPENQGKHIDIRFRMLEPSELARATSFPEDYKFVGTRREVIKQIGNAVPVRIATALCKAVLEETLGKRVRAVDQRQVRSREDGTGKQIAV